MKSQCTDCIGHDFCESTYYFENSDEECIRCCSMREHDNQIRLEAIDECIEALGNNIWDIAKLEQLKEQKGEENG